MNTSVENNVSQSSGAIAQAGGARVAAAPMASARTAPEKPAVAAVDPAELRQNLEQAVATLNEQMRQKGRGLNFALDDRINRTIITVRSTASGEVVRQIPEEVVIKVAHNIENIKGLLMDELA